MSHSRALLLEATTLAVPIVELLRVSVLVGLLSMLYRSFIDDGDILDDDE